MFSLSFYQYFTCLSKSNFSEDSPQLPISICLIHCMFISPVTLNPGELAKCSEKGKDFDLGHLGKIFTTT